MNSFFEIRLLLKHFSLQCRGEVVLFAAVNELMGSFMISFVIQQKNLVKIC